MDGCRRILIESAGIALWIAGQRPALQPVGASERVLAYRWIVFPSRGVDGNAGQDA